MELGQVEANAQRIMGDTIFMNGLHQDIRDHVRMMGPMTLQSKVQMAQSYWTVKYGGQTSLENELPAGLLKKLSPVQLQTTAVTPVNNEEEEESIFRPAVGFPIKGLKPPKATRAKDPMEEITEKFARMEAHIADMDRRYQNPRPAYRQGSYSIQQPQRETRECFLCHKEDILAEIVREELGAKEDHKPM